MSGDIIPFPSRPGRPEAQPREPGSFGPLQSPTLLLAKAVLYALTPDQKARARAYLLQEDPQRIDPATGLVERIMRRVRQAS